MSDAFDPCAMLATLRTAYYALLGGSKAQEVQFQDGRRVRYTPTDTASLKTAMADLETQCAAASGNTKPRRFAIVAG